MDVQLTLLVPGTAPAYFFDDDWLVHLETMCRVVPDATLLCPKWLKESHRIKSCRVIPFDVVHRAGEVVPGLGSALKYLSGNVDRSFLKKNVVVNGTFPVWGERLGSLLEQAPDKVFVTVEDETDYLAQVVGPREVLDIQYFGIIDRVAAEVVAQNHGKLLGRMGWSGRLKVSTPFRYPMGNVYGDNIQNQLFMDRLDDLIIPLCLGDEIPECLPEGHTCKGMLLAVSGDKCRWVAPDDGIRDSLVMPCGDTTAEILIKVAPNTQELRVCPVVAEGAFVVAAVPVCEGGVDEKRAASVKSEVLPGPVGEDGYVGTGLFLPAEAYGVVIGIHCEAGECADFLMMQEAPEQEWELDQVNIIRTLPGQGREISCRQLMPTFRIPDGLLVGGTLENLGRFDELLAAESVAVVPQNFSLEMARKLKYYKLKYAMFASGWRGNV